MTIRFAVLTLSDKGSAGLREDKSGPLVRALIERGALGKCVEEAILPDDKACIEAELIRLADKVGCHLIVTTGGTGLSPRDVTPEATRAVVDREVPGMAEAMRAAGMAKTPRAMLSRGICGLRNCTLIINLSGSPKAVREQLEAVLAVLPHAIETAQGLAQDCAGGQKAGTP